MMWFTRAIVVAFAGVVALVGIGLIGAGRTERKRGPKDRLREGAARISSLETVGLGLFSIGVIGVLVDLAG